MINLKTTILCTVLNRKKHIPCPVDPSHTIWAHKVAGHVLKCSAAKKQTKSNKKLVIVAMMWEMMTSSSKGLPLVAGIAAATATVERGGVGEHQANKKDEKDVSSLLSLEWAQGIV